MRPRVCTVTFHVNADEEDVALDAITPPLGTSSEEVRYFEERNNLLDEVRLLLEALAVNDARAMTRGYAYEGEFGTEDDADYLVDVACGIREIAADLRQD